jgi:hypothetical protein
MRERVAAGAEQPPDHRLAVLLPDPEVGLEVVGDLV